MTNQGAKTATLNASTTSYTIPAGYHNGAGSVSISTQTKTYTPTGAAATISPDSGKLLSSVTINAMTAKTASVTANANTGSQTYNVTAGYYNKVTANQTAAYNAGKASVASNPTFASKLNNVGSDSSTTQTWTANAAGEVYVIVGPTWGTGGISLTSGLETIKSISPNGATAIFAKSTKAGTRKITIKTGSVNTQYVSVFKIN